MKLQTSSFDSVCKSFLSCSKTMPSLALFARAISWKRNRLVHELRMYIWKIVRVFPFEAYFLQVKAIAIFVTWNSHCWPFFFFFSCWEYASFTQIMQPEGSFLKHIYIKAVKSTCRGDWLWGTRVLQQSRGSGHAGLFFSGIKPAWGTRQDLAALPRVAGEA